MEAYPPQYTEHNLPLVVLTGLGERQDDLKTGPTIPRQESGTKFSCNSPDCEGERAKGLLQQFVRLDGRDAAWSSQALSGPAGMLKYSMKAIGRVGTALARSRVIGMWTDRLRATPSRHVKLHHCHRRHHLMELLLCR